MSTKKPRKKCKERHQKGITLTTKFSFFDSAHQHKSSKKIFGLCDDVPPPHKPAYLNETDGNKWIAVVDNYYEREVLFVALDNSITLWKPDGTQDRCSDGMLSYDKTIIFVELTTGTSGDWKQDKDKQLRITIKHFEETKESDLYKVKQAYIANKNWRKPNSVQNASRMKNFLHDTGYILRIQNRIPIG